jgi:hypothetical protein
MGYRFRFAFGPDTVLAGKSTPPFAPADLAGFHTAYDSLTASTLYSNEAGSTLASVSGTDRVRHWKPSYDGGDSPNLTNSVGGLYVVENGVPTCKLYEPPTTRNIIEATLPGGSVSRTALTLYYLCKRVDWSSVGAREGYLRISTRGNAPGWHASAGGHVATIEGVTSSSSGIGGTPDLSWHVYAVTYHGTNGVRMFVDGGEVSPADGQTAPGYQTTGVASSFTHNAYALGWPNATDSQYAALYAYAAEHTPADVRQMTAYLRQRFSALFSPSAPVVIWTGASNFMDVATTGGGNQLVKTSVPWKCLANTSAYTRHHWGPRPGQTTVHQRARVTDEIARYAGWCTGDVVVCHYAGGNDSGIGTAAQIYAQLEGLVDDLHALGPNVKVVLGTYLPRTSFNDTVRGDVNDLIVANTAGADAVADWAADTTIGDDGDNANTTYYNSDGIHLLDAGTTVGYPYWLDEIEALLA